MKKKLLIDIEVKQIFHPWHLWECYKNGFYNAKRKGLKGEDIYKEFLSDLNKFNAGIDKVLSKWIYSPQHFLTNPNINRIAWLGQAACNIETGMSSFYRAGFFLLTDIQQQEANECSRDRIIEYLKSL